MKSRSVIFSIFLLMALVLSACAAPAEAPQVEEAEQAEQAEEAAPAEEEAEEEEVDLGSVRLIGNGELEFASLDVYYWQESLVEMGMGVEFNWVDSPDTALRAIISGSAEAYVGSLTSAFYAVLNTDADLRVLAINNQATDYVLLVGNDITSLDDLEGGTIGISTPGSAADTIIRTSLQLDGYDPENFQFVEIGGTSARITALLSGQIDAAPAHAADAAAVVATGEGHVILSAGESIGLYLQSGLIASGEWIDNNPAQVQAVVDAFIDASRWAATEKNEYLSLSVDLLPDDFESDVERSNTYDLYVGAKFWPVNGGVGQDGIDAWIGLEQGSGGLPAELPEQSLWLDDTFVKNYVDTHPEMSGN